MTLSSEGFFPEATSIPSLCLDFDREEGLPQGNFGVEEEWIRLMPIASDIGDQVCDQR